MQQRTKILLALCFVVGLLVYGYLDSVSEKAVPEGQTDGYPLKLVDSYQREVTLEREPARIISAAPNITEIIYALGKGDRLVGRTDYCDFPAAALRVDSIGRMTDPSIEKIIQLQPDVVIASTHFQKAVLEKLEAVGVKAVVYYGPESFAGVYRTIHQVGQTLNAQREAAALIATMRQQVEGVTRRVQAAPKPKVYYVVGYGRAGDYTAGKDTFIGNMIEMAGGVNVANDTKGWQYSLEKLVEKNPDLLICSRFFNMKSGIEQSPGYRELPAVQAGMVLEIDNNLLDRQGPRTADGLAALAKLLHPELFDHPSEEPNVQ